MPPIHRTGSSVGGPDLTYTKSGDHVHVFTYARGTRSARFSSTLLTALVALFTGGLLLALSGTAQAATTPVPLGTAESFAVLAGASVSNVPISAITGDVGVSPAAGSTITGLTCPEVDGTIYVVNASGPPCRKTDAGLLTQAKNDLTTAYLDAAARTPDMTLAEGDNQLGGKTLGPGVYRFGHATTANLSAT